MGDGFPAHTYNAMVDIINAYRKGQLTNLGVGIDTIRSAGIVEVKNASGSAKGRLSVLGIDQPLILPSADFLEFKDKVRLSGVVPTSNHEPDLFCVLREPLEANAVGLATVAGACPAIVDVQSESHGYAACIEGDASSLYSRTFGGARILWKESGTGSKRAIIRMGPPPEIGIVEIDGSSCEEIERSASTCLWSGSLKSVAVSSPCSPWTTGEAVWVLETNVCDTQGPDAFKKVRGGEVFIGARLGTYDNGGDVREIYAIRNPDIGKVRVNNEDNLNFLEDQYEDHVDTPTYVEGDLLVKSQTDVVSDDQMIRRFVDTAGYSSDKQYLTHPAGSDTPTWDSEPEDKDEKVAVSSTDTPDYLENQYTDHVAAGTYIEGDLLIKSETDTDSGTGDQTIRRFVDTANYNSNEQQLTHPGGSDTPTWKDVTLLTVITDLRLNGTTLEKRTSTLKAIDVSDQGWSTALPTTEC